MRSTSAERPALLVELQDGDLANEIAEEMELDLEFHPGFEHGWQRAWGMNEEAASSVHAFAQDGTGGQVCLWQRAQQAALEEAPVVVCGSEGELEVLALNLADYFVQVVWGYDHFGAGPADLPHSEGARVLRALGIEVPDDPTGLRSAAQAANPDFEAWIRARCGG
jgi:hypothetical protein